ncbi:hypothetical protein RND71_030835 [Anisodus tanguticus]|uniref:Uncharacterized protein n=1 Tax=Anisodus tanguticus TaxID=243964 RepID=A0AAE1RIE9_9SOLA|nr:hypothetical protein RND71_030835 [Anisodus tanguticus]
MLRPLPPRPLALMSERREGEKRRRSKDKQLLLLHREEDSKSKETSQVVVLGDDHDEQSENGQEAGDKNQESEEDQEDEEKDDGNKEYEEIKKDNKDHKDEEENTDERSMIVEDLRNNYHGVEKAIDFYSIKMASLKPQRVSFAPNAIYLAKPQLVIEAPPVFLFATLHIHCKHNPLAFGCQTSEANNKLNGFECA